MKPEPQLPVFVYGTLRPGGANYQSYLAGRTRREVPATVSGGLYMVDDEDYPCLLAESGRVGGELVELSPEHYEVTLRRLDELEEYDPTGKTPNVYLRRRVKAVLNNGEEVEAWVYYWNGPAPKSGRIPGGDFRCR